MAKTIKYCELDENKICDDCNQCNICDLDDTKTCDSCGKCIDMEDGKDYIEVDIDGVFDENEEAEEYISDMPTTSNEAGVEYFEYDYIEDIPELKNEYDQKIFEILHPTKENSKHEDKK
jgi:hypothetical protein